MDAQTIAEALKTEPFHVDPAVAGHLDPRLLETAKSKAEGLDFDVYVIAVPDDHIDRDLLEQIKVFNGGEGSFIMVNGKTDLAVDVHFEDDHDLQMQVMEQMSVGYDTWSHGTPSLTKLNILLDLYADPQTAPDELPGETVEEVGQGEVVQDTSSSFAPLFLGGSVLVLALVIAGVFLLRGLRQRRAQARRQQAYQLPGELLRKVDSLQRRSLRESIHADTASLAERLDRLRLRTLDETDAARVTRALDAYQWARTIVDDETADRLDLAGAMVLLRQAGREIAEVSEHRRRRGRQGGLPQSLCTVNPLHGEATTTARVDADARSVRVPVCADCSADLREGNQLQWIFDGDRPYVEGSSIWSQTLFGVIGGDLVTALQRRRPDARR
ncbi:hypothetical protein DFO66_11519 [Brevibacterium sanguinis]|uniref:Uncharacterized protein n=2 Tax=Brevibacterium TaxID=1696 RepID=A0A366ICS8_9MICO|nr:MULTISPECIES: hypothetical protein [Brevibacterium]RBP62353.1 hypothetical protein DFO66_11519 [Brevibacterium sanguinis]RBP68742.1 hypothetical protein DFO65_11519 [Brevibacterium celere]